MDYRLSEGFTVLRNGNIQARSKKSLKRADFKRVLGTLFNRPLSFFLSRCLICQNMIIYWSGTGHLENFGPSRFQAVLRRPGTSMHFILQFWPEIPDYFIDWNRSAHNKLPFVFGLLPGMFLRDENILIKIK